MMFRSNRTLPRARAAMIALTAAATVAAGCGSSSSGSSSAAKASKPATLRLGAVHLAVAVTDWSVAWYESALGLGVASAVAVPIPLSVPASATAGERLPAVRATAPAEAAARIAGLVGR